MYIPTSRSCAKLLDKSTNTNTGQGQTQHSQPPTNRAAAGIASSLLRNHEGAVIPSASRHHQGQNSADQQEISKSSSHATTKALKSSLKKLSSTDSHAGAGHLFSPHYLPRKNGSALLTADILKPLKSLKSLELTDLLYTSDDGRMYSQIEKFPTADPQNPLRLPREINKAPDIGNKTITPRKSFPLLKQAADRSYSVTDLTFAAASTHYNRKHDINILSAGPLKHTTSSDQAKKIGASIAEKLSSLEGKKSMGISVNMETDSDHAPHRISVALHQSQKNGRLTIVLNDSVKSNYQAWGHEERVDSILSGIKEEFKKHSNQENQEPPLTLVATDRNIQNDLYACGTISLVVLKELLKDDGALIEDMVRDIAREEKTDKMTGNAKVEVGLPPAIYRITQSPEKITDEEKSTIFRPNKNKTVQDKLNEFNLPNGTVSYSVKKESFPPNWSKNDITRTAGLEGYTKKRKGVYTKTVEDPQNGYLRAKSLAFAKLAINAAKEHAGEDDPKEKLKSMFSKIHIPCPDL